MYQGKFDNKRKKADSNVRDLVAQRNGEPENKKKVPESELVPAPTPAPASAPAEEPVPVKKQKKAAPKAEVTEVPEQQPEKTPEKKPEKKKARKKSSRKGSAVFYTFYIMFVLLFAAASFLGYRWLENWLTDYQAAQEKCQEVFEELFADPDWGKLYEQAGIEDTLFEGKDAYVAHMQSKVGDAELTCLETSVGLSQGKKYVVRLGTEKIAAFTMEGQREFITDIPDWHLGRVELYLDRSNTVRIQRLEGNTAYVNGVALDDSYTVQIAGTAAEDFLPMGMTGVRMYTQEVTGLMAEPVVTVMDETGANLQVDYDEVSGCYIAQTDFNTISDEHRELALEAVKTYCKWMIKEANGRGSIAKYFDPSSDIYRDIVVAQDTPWMEEHNGFKFDAESVSGYTLYGDGIFSVRVAMSLQVTRTDGTVKEYAFDQALFFNKKDDGRWLCYEMTDEDVSLPRGEVRLTFMDGEEMLTTGFYNTDASDLIVPVLSAPKGKVFAGWALKAVDDSGRTTQTMVFQPDFEGKVQVPEGTALVPMVLYACYEDAGKGNTPAENVTEEVAVETAEAAETEAPEATGLPEAPEVPETPVETEPEVTEAAPTAPEEKPEPPEPTDSEEEGDA